MSRMKQLPDMQTLGQLSFSPQPHISQELTRYASALRRAVPPVLEMLIGKSSPETDSRINVGLALLNCINEAEAEQLCLHPYFCYWWSSLRQVCHRRTRTGLHDWMSHLHRFLVVPALNSGVRNSAPLSLSATDGVIRFPGVGEVSVASRGVATGRLDEGRLRLTDDGHDVFVPLDNMCEGKMTRAVTRSRDIEISSRDPWLSTFFSSIAARALARGDGAWDCAHAPVAGDVFQPALDLLHDADPNWYTEFTGHTRLLVPFRSAQYSSLTEGAFSGAVFVSEAVASFNATLLTAEHLLHEHSHFILSLILENDAIATDDGTFYSSPWRTEARPLMGMLHGIFVFARIARFMRQCAERSLCAGAETRRVQVVQLTSAALAQVQRNKKVRLTRRGELLMAEIAAELRL